jgi:ketosteroid isomerase-like protein
MRCLFLFGVVVLMAGCGSSVNVEEERANLLALDREWAQSAKDTEKYLSYFAPDASMYPQGMPLASGPAALREMATQMNSTPGFSLAWTAGKADVAASGDLGYTAGSYEMTMGEATERGKYVTVWKKQPNGEWKVSEDIGNSDAPQNAAAQHVMVAPSAITWVDAPPGLPPGSQMAVVSGDPAQAQPFVIRARVPAGYRIAPHWHPTAENLTVLTGTIALGMGEQFDQAALTDLGPGGYATMPAEMRHFFLARTAATFQVHAMGPFVVNYVNPADDPGKQPR